jgi:hypothetical protein
MLVVSEVFYPAVSQGKVNNEQYYGISEPVDRMYFYMLEAFFKPAFEIEDLEKLLQRYQAGKRSQPLLLKGDLR